MTTYYVSNTLVNNIPAGSGSGSGSVVDPFLTLQEALDALGVDNSDTIYMNDGTYLLESGATGANILGFDGLSLLGVTDYGATLTSQAGATRMLWIRSDEFTIGKINVVASSNASRALDDASGPHNQITINGTYFSGGGSNPIVAIDTCDNATMSEGWTIEKTVAGSGDSMILGGGANGGIYNISDGTIINQGISTGDESGVTFNHLNGVSGDTHFNCWDINFQVDDTLLTSSDYVCVYCSGAQTADIHHLTLDNTNSTLTGFTSLVFVLGNSEACIKAHIHDIHAVIHTTPVGGNSRGIDVGGNASTANDNTIANAVIENCSMTGCSHGFLLGYSTGNTIRKCFSDLCLSGFVIKGCTDSICEGNISIRSTQNYFLNKAGTSDTFRFNTVKMTDGYGASAFKTSESDADCVTPFFYNNVVEADVAVVAMFDMAATTAIVPTVKYNNIYSSETLPAAAFTNLTTDYATLSAFETAVTNADANTEHDAALQADYSITTASPIYGIGVNTWAGSASPQGYNEPVPSYDIEPGAVVSTKHPFHPKNL